MNIQISNRMKTIAKHIPKGTYFADIGSDHALLPCFVCQHDQLSRAIAGEVQEGPYKSAMENVRKYGLEYQIDVSLGDGLQVVNDKVDLIVIAGMGGKLISRILYEGKNKLLNITQLILQPNNHAQIVREALIQLNFNLSFETIMEENEKTYEILIANKNTPSPYNDQIEKQLMFGPYLLKEKNEIFKKYWQSEYNNFKKVIKNIRQSKSNQRENLKLFERKLMLIEEVLNE